METSTLFKQVLNHLGEYLETDVSFLTRDSRLSSSVPNLDSLKLLEMILYLEDCFQVNFDELVIERFETLGDLVEYIDSLLKHKTNRSLSC